MNEVTTTQEVLLVEVVLDEDILRRNRTAGIADIGLAFPLAVRNLHADTYIGNVHTVYTLLVYSLVGAVQKCSIHKDTA